jgi:hypothetical protein
MMAAKDICKELSEETWIQKQKGRFKSTQLSDIKCWIISHKKEPNYVEHKTEECSIAF